MIARTSGRMAHDLKNLLTAIVVNADVALEDLDRNGRPQREELEEVLKAAHRANAMLDQLLAFGRRQMLRIEVVDANLAVGEAVEALRRQAPEGYHIQFSPSTRKALVRTDRQQLTLLVRNLVHNAWEALTDLGTAITSVEVVDLAEARRYGDVEVPPAAYVVLSVEDRGRGMPPHVLDRVFQPFFTTKDQQLRMGLGLSVAYGVVKQSGGYIFASSREEVGSLFEVYLPAEAGAVEERVGAEGAAGWNPGEEALD